MACGSGALAVALAAEVPRGGGGTFTLWPPAGTPLTVTLEPEPGRATLSGGAQLVFEGQLDPNWLPADASE